MERKGVNYDVGIETNGFMSRPVFDTKIVQRELEIIKNDLNCNSVRISGTDPGRLMIAAEVALKQGLEVWLSPHLHDKTEQETIDYTAKCAEMTEQLRLKWPDLVFILGCELTLFMQGILEGNNIFERISNPAFIDNVKTGVHNKKLNAFLTKANEAVRKVFRGKVTYASAPLEGIDWNLFDYISLDRYREVRNKAVYAEQLKSYFVYSKPVIITEVGCCTYQGAENSGGRGWLIVDRTKPKQLNGDYVRDEGLQAQEITEQLTILERAGVDGIFVFTFVSPAMSYNENPRQDLDMASYSLVKSYVDKHGVSYPEMPWEPKESFRATAKYFAKLKA